MFEQKPVTVPVTSRVPVACQLRASCVLAGGGLNHCGAYGETDELGKKIVRDPVSVAGLFAKIHAAVRFDYSKNLYDGDRPVPMTDMGQPIAKLFG